MISLGEQQPTSTSSAATTMVLLALQRLMSMLHIRQSQSADGLIASENEQEGSACQQDGDADADPQAAETTGCSIPYLPEDIWHHVHSLMPMRDAARAACVSRAFLRSWRRYPNLTFSRHVFGTKASGYGGGDFGHIADCIMRNHSGTGVKILNLELFCTTHHNLSSWLQVAVKPGIEELTLRLCRFNDHNEFPYSVLSNGVRNSIRHLELGFCAFHPTSELGPLPSLRSLHLSHVSVTGDELECLLSNSLALEQLELNGCMEIVCLRVPCELQRFSCLRILACRRLELIESRAPNLSSLDLDGNAKLSLGEALQMKKLSMSRPNAICYVRAELPSIMPNLDTLVLCSDDEEVVSTPMLSTKFLCLKHLTISLRSVTLSWSYDYFSLVSFLVASPSLETLRLDVLKDPTTNESNFGHPSRSRQVAGDKHCCLKNVKITGFNSAKSLVELACYILNNAVSLECLTLDTLFGPRCSDKGSQQCSPMGHDILREACRALVAIKTHIEGKVPDIVKFTIVEPCSRCHIYRGGKRPKNLAY